MPNPTNTFQIANVVIPQSGPKAVPVTVNWLGLASQLVDPSQLIQRGAIDYIQTVYVDNANNSNDLTIITDLVAQRIIVPAGAQGYYSVLAPNNPTFLLETIAGDFNTNLILLNVPIQPIVWQTPVTPIATAYADHSIANLSGASEALMPANNTRQILVIQNTGATDIAVNLTGGAAVLNTAGSITLIAGGSLVLDKTPPQSAITVIGTAGADVTAYEA